MKNRAAAALLGNIWYKITAVLLAALFWYIVQGEEILEVNRRVVVSFDIPKGMVVKGAQTRFKDATLRGPRVLLGDFSTKPLEALIHIPEGKTGPMRFRIDKEYFNHWDSRIKLTVHDPYLIVTVDEKAERRVPVKEVFQGQLAQGQMIEKTIIEPDMVTISGLKTEIMKIKEVLTEPIDIKDLSESKIVTVALARTLPADITVPTEKVQVKIMVGEQKINKKFPNIPIEVTGGEYMATVQPATTTVEIQGTQAVLSFVKKSDLKAFVDCHDLAPGNHQRDIQVKIPHDTTLIETLPAKASVEIYNQKRVN